MDYSLKDDTPKPGGSGRMNYGGRTYTAKLGTGDSMSLRVVDPNSMNKKYN
jgi:hypothetical protein